jgi:hypothetical protein
MTRLRTFHSHNKPAIASSQLTIYLADIGFHFRPHQWWIRFETGDDSPSPGGEGRGEGELMSPNELKSFREGNGRETSSKIDSNSRLKHQQTPVVGPAPHAPSASVKHPANIRAQIPI